MRHGESMPQTMHRTRSARAPSNFSFNDKSIFRKTPTYTYKRARMKRARARTHIHKRRRAVSLDFVSRSRSLTAHTKAISPCTTAVAVALLLKMSRRARHTTADQCYSMLHSEQRAHTHTQNTSKTLARSLSVWRTVHFPPKSSERCANWPRYATAPCACVGGRVHTLRVCCWR